MDVLRDPTPSSDLPHGGVVTIGNWDGVHIGHRMLLAGAVERARSLGAPAVALTFEPHPEKVLRPNSGLRLVTTRAQKLQLLDRMGIDTLVEIGFDRRFAAITAPEFAREFLFRRLAPAEVRLGTNFRSGAGRLGDVNFLSAIGHEIGLPWSASNRSRRAARSSRPRGCAARSPAATSTKRGGSWRARSTWTAACTGASASAASSGSRRSTSTSRTSCCPPTGCT